MKKLEFERKIRNNPRPVIVDLWAPWCTPCKAMAPAFKQVSQNYNGKVDVLKINADESPDVLKALNVMSIPTVLGFSGGNEIMRRTGVQTQGMLEFFFESTLKGEKPAIMPPAPATRLIRTILGLAVLLVGWLVYHSVPIIVLGGLVVFSGYYDRCPIMRALIPRVKTLFRSGKSAES